MPQPLIIKINSLSNPNGIVDSVDTIKPIFKTYLGVMSQFFDIYNFDKWCASAIKNLDVYSNNDYCHIYVIKKTDLIIGFIFINGHLRFNHDGLGVAEFFIQNDYAKKGYGRKLAQFAFNRFPGPWEIAVTKKNKSGTLFWKQVISSYTHGHYSVKEKPTFKGSGFVFNNIV